jgi:NAD-dependent dihydropyrimidine dehydrogenase PreA subunit
MTVKIDTLKCIGCGACTFICPVEALEVVDMKCRVSDKCIDCNKCVTACSWEAITPGEKSAKKKGSK